MVIESDSKKSVDRLSSNKKRTYNIKSDSIESLFFHSEI
jgi:hypothetical protein